MLSFCAKAYVSTDTSASSSPAIDVIVVSLNSGSKKLGHYLDRVYEGSGSLHITLEVVDDNTGTADALALIKDKIKVNRKTWSPLAGLWKLSIATG